MKNLLKDIFTKEEDREITVPITFDWGATLSTPEEAFRMNTIKDINYLLKEGKAELATLEAKKLIEHLKKECNLA